MKGIHGAGAALYAKQHRGAELGVGEGITGNPETPCYALPTKGYQIEKLPLATIQKSVDRFLSFAEEHYDELGFKVTCVGCGLGGYTHKDIAPMFKDAPANCFFDTLWLPYLGKDKLYWGSY